MSSSVNKNHSNCPSNANGRPNSNSSGAYPAQNGIPPPFKISSYLTGQKEILVDRLHLAQVKLQLMVVFVTVIVLLVDPTQAYCLRMASILTTLSKHYKISNHLQEILVTISGL